MMTYSCSRASAGADINFGIRCLVLLKFKVGYLRKGSSERFGNWNKSFAAALP
jgi:hypothetical protein